MFAMFRPWEAFKQQPDQIPAPLFLAFFHQKDAGIPLPTGDFSPGNLCPIMLEPLHPRNVIPHLVDAARDCCDGPH